MRDDVKDMIFILNLNHIGLNFWERWEVACSKANVLKYLHNIVS